MREHAHVHGHTFNIQHSLCSLGWGLGRFRVRCYQGLLLDPSSAILGPHAGRTHTTGPDSEVGQERSPSLWQVTCAGSSLLAVRTVLVVVRCSLVRRRDGR